MAVEENENCAIDEKFDEVEATIRRAQRELIFGFLTIAGTLALIFNKLAERGVL